MVGTDHCILDICHANYYLMNIVLVAYSMWAEEAFGGNAASLFYWYYVLVVVVVYVVEVAIEVCSSLGCSYFCYVQYCYYDVYSFYA